MERSVLGIGRACEPCVIDVWGEFMRLIKTYARSQARERRVAHPRQRRLLFPRLPPPPLQHRELLLTPLKHPIRHRAIRLEARGGGGTLATSRNGVQWPRCLCSKRKSGNGLLS